MRKIIDIILSVTIILAFILIPLFAICTLVFGVFKEAS